MHMNSNYSGGSYQTTPNSTMAVISLVAGILGLSLFPTIGSIIALITGYMARNEIRVSAGSLGGDGLATAGIVLGWIGIGLSVIGLCIAGFFLIPLCLIPLGIGLEGMSLLFSVFFFM
jgi:hypothetical protein